MILLYSGKWRCKAGRLLKYSRVYTNKGRPTPLVIARFRHVGREPAALPVMPPVAAETRKLVRVCGQAEISALEFDQAEANETSYHDMFERGISKAKSSLFNELSPKISVIKTMRTDGILFSAELWIAEEACHE